MKTMSEEETRSPLALAAVAAKQMILEDILLISSDFALKPNTPASPEARLCSEFGFKADHAHDVESKGLLANVSFYVKGFFREGEEGQEEIKDLFRIEADYLVNYKQRGDESIPQESIDSFADLNGIYNCWPYWREYVQNITS